MNSKPLTKYQKKLVEENIGLIGFVLKRYTFVPWNAVVSKEDRFQAGFFGLRRAAQLFNPKKKFRFSTYATRWIFQSMSRTSCNEGFHTVRLPVYMVQRKWNEKSEDAKNAMAESINVDDLFLTTENHQAVRNLEEWESKILVNQFLEKLPRKYKKVIQYRFGLTGYRPQTLRNVGKRMHLTYQRIQQIEKVAMRKLQRLCHTIGEI